MWGKTFWVLSGAALVALPSLDAQQTFEPIQFGSVTLTGSVRDRVEDWEWFTPNTGDPRYAFNGTTIRLGLSQNRHLFDFHDVFGTEASTLQLGRFDFQDGGEVTSKDPTVAAVKRDRIQQRLIGPFTFTDVMRAFEDSITSMTTRP